MYETLGRNRGRECVESDRASRAVDLRDVIRKITAQCMPDEGFKIVFDTSQEKTRVTSPHNILRWQQTVSKRLDVVFPKG